MRRKPLPATWSDVRRAALDAAARAVLVDPTASETLVEEATRHLESSIDGALADAERVLPRLSVETLRRIRADLTGTPIVSHVLPTETSSEPDPEPARAVAQPDPAFGG